MRVSKPPASEADYRNGRGNVTRDSRSVPDETRKSRESDSEDNRFSDRQRGDQEDRTHEVLQPLFH